MVPASYPKVRIEPACTNFVALVEVVPEGISKKVRNLGYIFQGGSPPGLGDRCPTESAVMVSMSRAFQNATTFDLRLISHRGRLARSLPIKILVHW